MILMKTDGATLFLPTRLQKSTIMSEPQLTGLQKRASKYINKRIVYQVRPGDTIEGNFIGFDKLNGERAVIQMSNAADRTTLPVMTVLGYFEGVEDDE
jgi:hypothetical protein